jgi:hypothetical protein
MAEQVPSIGRIVHFVYGDREVPAIITDPVFHRFDADHPRGEGTEQALTVFPVNAPPFTTAAPFDDSGAAATWHWPEFVPPKSDERRDYGTSNHPMTKAEADAEPGVSGETGA